MIRSAGSVVLTAVLFAAPARAADVATGGGTIGLVVEADGHMSAQAAQAIAWHALWSRHGHRAVVFDELTPAVVPTMVEQKMTSLLEVTVSWEPFRAVDDLADRVTAARRPIVECREYELRAGRLYARTKWRTDGAVAIYAVEDDAGSGYVAMPEVALQEAMDLAVTPLGAPVWTGVPAADLVKVPLVVGADDEYRAFYGPDWKKHTTRRVARANALLAPAAIELTITGYQDWESDDRLTGLSALLDDLAAAPHLDARSLRVAFTQQTDLATEFHAVSEDVGRAYLPGRDVVLADQALPPGHTHVWDETEEAIALAHEVLHALGVPHREDDYYLMSGRKSSTVHAMHPSTAELAHVAALARYAHWDAIIAVTQLSEAAASHLTDAGLQHDYIAENLAVGPGVPRPGEIDPTRLSALSNVAIGHYYLRLAAEEPDEDSATALRHGAVSQARKALEQRPHYSAATDLLLLAEAATHPIGALLVPLGPRPVAPPPAVTPDESAPCPAPAAGIRAPTCQ